MSIRIKSFSSEEVDALAELARKTFLESHGHSAAPEDIQHYIDSHFKKDVLLSELNHPGTYINKILVDNQLAGYSKLILNSSHSITHSDPIAKFERLYLLKKFYGLGVGREILAHTINTAKKHNQKALWLFVWTQNVRALKFYQKNGFKVIGNDHFKLSENHSNLDYIMLKEIQD